MKELYNYLDKRLSIRTIDKNNLLTQEDLNIINDYLPKIKSLDENIKLEYELVKNNKTNSKIGEYNLLIYCDNKINNPSDLTYLVNVGYMIEQLDLYLFSKNIGCCWLGLPKPKQELKKDNYVIMLGLSKIKEDNLRKDINDFKRKKINEVWDGQFNNDVMNKTILAPSACNSQSWKVKVKDNKLLVFRDPLIKTIIPRSFRKYFNSIDLGIFLCFLEIALEQHNICFAKEIKVENECNDDNLIPIATYCIK